MPAGKMVLAYKAGAKKRPYRRRRTTRFRKAVAKIAKTTLMREAETKTSAVTIAQNFGTAGFLQDIWQPVTTGATQSNRIGDEIRALGVRFRGKFEQNPAVITGNQSQNTIRVMFVVGKRPLATGDMPSAYGTVDPELMTVLRDFYINFETTKIAKWFNFYVPFKRLVKYDAAGAPTRCPIYMWCASAGGTGLLTTSGNTADYIMQRYWKDV